MKYLAYAVLAVWAALIGAALLYGVCVALRRWWDNFDRHRLVKRMQQQHETEIMERMRQGAAFAEALALQLEEIRNLPTFTGTRRIA